MSKAQKLYTIKIHNWLKHNQNKKINHRYFLLENRIFNDAKISQLTAYQLLLYLYLLTICADTNSDLIHFSPASIPYQLRTKGVSIPFLLNALESFQLLTIEKNESFNNTIEKKTIENKRKELKPLNDENHCSEPKNLVPNLRQKKEQILVKITDDKEIGINKDLINSWSDTFPKEFLEMEFKKARSWLIANSHKSPKKDFGKFFNSWFNRGWDAYRKTLSSNPTKITVDDLQESIERWSL